MPLAWIGELELIGTFTSKSSLMTDSTLLPLPLSLLLSFFLSLHPPHSRRGGSTHPLLIYLSSSYAIDVVGEL